MQRSRLWRNGLALLAVAGAVSFVAVEASAQGYGRQSASSRLQRPTVSPYLNLFRRGSNGMPNYQTLVRPELQQLRTNSMQQSEISQLRTEIAAEQRQVQTRELPQTGHESRFRYYSHFYSRKK
jgi:hypothetical protein